MEQQQNEIANGVIVAEQDLCIANLQEQLSQAKDTIQDLTAKLDRQRERTLEWHQHSDQVRPLYDAVTCIVDSKLTDDNFKEYVFQLLHDVLNNSATVREIIRSESDIDHECLAEHIDYAELAERIDAYSIARELDNDEIAASMDHFDVAHCLDEKEIARNVDVEDVAGYIDLDELADALSRRIEVSVRM